MDINKKEKTLLKIALNVASEFDYVPSMDEIIGEGEFQALLWDLGYDFTNPDFIEALSLYENESYEDMKDIIIEKFFKK